MKIVHLFIILYERNPEEQDPHIAVLEDARISDHISTQLLKALNGRWVLDYPKPRSVYNISPRPVTKVCKLTVVGYAHELQAEFQNGFPDVTKPEG